MRRYETTCDICKSSVLTESHEPMIGWHFMQPMREHGLSESERMECDGEVGRA